MTYEAILKKYWGFDSFRPLQKEIIDTVVKGKDVVAILPTGSGKSLIYQVAGLSRQGLTLVISPLIALIEDQTNKLNSLGIKSIALSGPLPFYEMERLMDNALYSDNKFLFLSPERLQNNYIRKRLENADIGLVVVDEAHCISEWGHDFRPSYLKIAQLNEFTSNVPFLALTATAGDKVLDDIVKYLSLNQPVIFRESVKRENLRFKVWKTGDKNGTILQELKKDETALVYVNMRKKTYEISYILETNGYKSAAFHGGMDFHTKQKVLEEWLQNQTKIIVATNAFGMGIDKPDVRKVIHNDLPFSLENYLQEAGRAGRDGKMSEAILLFNANDIDKDNNFFLNKIPRVEEIIKVYKRLYTYYHIAENEGEGMEFDFDYKDFCQKYQLDLFKTLDILKILESEEIIQLKNQYSILPEVKIEVSPAQIRTYFDSGSKYTGLLDILIRQYSDIFYQFVKIKPDKIAEILSVEIQLILNYLNELSKQGIISYKPPGKDFRILFLMSKDEYFLQRKIKDFKKRIQIKKEKLQAVIDYVTNEKICRTRFLSRYFGEKNTEDCMICDICIKNHSTLTDDDILLKIKELLKDEAMNKRELQKYFTVNIDKHLDFLIEQKKIKFNILNKYELNEKK